MMNLERVYPDFEPTNSVLADLARIQQLWAMAWEKYGNSEPWLFGRYSLADVFYAPIASRIVTFNLPVDARAEAYVAAHISDPAFETWRKAGAERVYEKKPHAVGMSFVDWPGPRFSNL